MYPRVTAIIVAQKGGSRLQRTLDALSSQTRRPDAVVAVACGGTDDVTRIFQEWQPSGLVSIPERIPFGEAVGYAVGSLPEADSPDEVLWLLAQDTAPEPRALEALLAALEVSPSVGVVGPKLVDDDDPTFIREFGQTMTPFGASAPLVENELDQAQHDSLSDVLAVSSAGMLIRHTVWMELGGFDPALPTIDDGLDLCVRVRLAGYRVSLVAAARVAVRGSGLAGPNLSHRWSVRRRLDGERRRAQLHRRMAYAPAWALVPHWLSLVPLAFLRALTRLVRKEPGSIGGELAAAFGVAFSGMSIPHARSRRTRAQSAGWSAIAPLRMPFADARRIRALKRETALLALQGERQEFNFFTTGGAWTVVAALLVSIIIFFPVLGSSALVGGGFQPLSSSLDQLWQNASYGWRDINVGLVGPADPFSAVLAVLGTLTFWQPSLALVILYIVALPLSALGAWLAAARLSVRGIVRSFAALGYAFAPTFLVALTQGRPSAIIAHLLLPWLFFAGLAARRSWATSATTAILAAATIACSPLLIAPLAVIWLVLLAFAGWRAARIAFIPVPTLVLFAPLAIAQFLRGTPLAVFADPGVPLSSPRTPAWQLALGFPDDVLGGWHTLAGHLGISSAVPNTLVPILLAPLGILAILALFLRGTVRALMSLFVALVAFLTALVALHLSVQTNGGHVVAVWAGTAISLYWLGLLGAAVIGLSAVGRSAPAPAWAAILTLAVVIVPFPLALRTGSVTVHGINNVSTMPALVSARAATGTGVRTLVLEPQGSDSLRATTVSGAGTTLDAQSTLASTQTSLTEQQRQLAQLAGNLVSRSGFDSATALKGFGIDFVLLNASSSSTSPVAERARTALDATAVLTPIGATSAGELWAVTNPATPTLTATSGRGSGGLRGLMIALFQSLIFAVTLLMALPIRPSPDRVAELHAIRLGYRGRRFTPGGSASPSTHAPIMPDDRLPTEAISRVTEPEEDVSAWDVEPEEEAAIGVVDESEKLTTGIDSANNDASGGER